MLQDTAGPEVPGTDAPGQDIRNFPEDHLRDRQGAASEGHAIESAAVPIEDHREVHQHQWLLRRLQSLWDVD